MEEMCKTGLQQKMSQEEEGIEEEKEGIEMRSPPTFQPWLHPCTAVSRVGSPTRMHVLYRLRGSSDDYEYWRCTSTRVGVRECACRQ